MKHRSTRIGWLIFASLFSAAVVVGVQFWLAHQLSNMIRDSRAQAAAIADARRAETTTQFAALGAQVAAEEKQLAALREAYEGLSDQLNTFGRDTFDPQRRRLSLLRQMRQVGRPFVLVLGDSITQRARLPDDACGFPIINAGISGSRASDLVPFAEEIKAQHAPVALIVLAVGVNDAQKRYQTSFPQSYPLLINSLPRTKLALASLAPVDFSGTDGRNMSAELYSQVDSTIRRSASELKLPLIDLSILASEHFQTLDGVHLTIDAYAAWNAAVLAGIKSSLGC